MRDGQVGTREHQTMGVSDSLDSITATHVLDRLEDTPSRGSADAIPGHSLPHAKEASFRRVMDVFYAGSLEDAKTAHLPDAGTDMSEDGRMRLSEIIGQARKKGRS